jgi:hypothetical protein
MVIPDPKLRGADDEEIRKNLTNDEEILIFDLI